MRTIESELDTMPWHPILSRLAKAGSPTAIREVIGQALSTQIEALANRHGGMEKVSGQLRVRSAEICLEDMIVRECQRRGMVTIEDTHPLDWASEVVSQGKAHWLVQRRLRGMSATIEAMSAGVSVGGRFY